MRRTLATLLAFTFSTLLVLPFFSFQAESTLPACCRRTGQHHCMMMDMGGAPANGVTVSAIGSRCPCFPHLSAATAHIEIFEPASILAASTIGLHPTGIVAQAEAGFRVSSSRSEQKRGPPSFLFS